MEHKGTRSLETDRLILRQFRADDAQAMFENWASDNEVTKYLMWPTHESIEISKKVLGDWIPQYSKDDFYLWAIVLKECGDTPIGSISVVDINEKIECVHIGYCIGRKWWQKGITSEALSGVIEFLFNQVKVNRIDSRHDPNNPGSGKVMLKSGMRYEGTMRDADWNNQGICHASRYAILRSDFLGEGNEH